MKSSSSELHSLEFHFLGKSLNFKCAKHANTEDLLTFYQFSESDLPKY